MDNEEKILKELRELNNNIEGLKIMTFLIMMSIILFSILFS